MFTPKPARGTALLASRQRRAERTAHEQREMQAALRRDERKCRVPRCEYATKKLRIEPAHMVHRGMGGDPSGERTTRATVISLCLVHHGQYDHGEIDIVPLTEQEFDGPCDWYVRNEWFEWELFASEKTIGVSVERGA